MHKLCKIRRKGNGFPQKTTRNKSIILKKITTGKLQSFIDIFDNPGGFSIQFLYFHFVQSVLLPSRNVRQEKIEYLKDGKMDGLRRLCRISEEWLHAKRWNVSLKAYIHNFIFPSFCESRNRKSSLSRSSPFPDCAEGLQLQN